MDTTERDAVLSRARKALALAKGTTNEGEAQAAMLAVQRILAEYHLSMKEVEQPKVAQSDVTSLVASAKGAKENWRGTLSVILAKNFRCFSFWEAGLDASNGYKHTARLIYVGTDVDVHIVYEVHQAACQCIEDLLPPIYAQRRRAYNRPLTAREAHDIRASLIQGFLDGLHSGFAAQVRQHKQEWGLVLVTPEAVTKYRQDLHLRNGRSSKVRSGTDWNARTQGQQAGHWFAKGHTNGVPKRLEE